MKIRPTILILPLAFVCVQCAEPEAPAVSETTLLSEEHVKSLGFSTQSTGAIEQSDWHKEQFGPATIHSQYVRSLTPMVDSPTMFPRFDVVREAYANSDLALSRFKRIGESDIDI